MSAFSTFKPFRRAALPGQGSARHSSPHAGAICVLLPNPSVGFRCPGMGTCRHHPPPRPPSTQAAPNTVQYSFPPGLSESGGPPASNPQDPRAGDRRPATSGWTRLSGRQGNWHGASLQGHTARPPQPAHVTSSLTPLGSSGCEKSRTGRKVATVMPCQLQGVGLFQALDPTYSQPWQGRRALQERAKRHSLAPRGTPVQGISVLRHQNLIGIKHLRIRGWARTGQGWDSQRQPAGHPQATPPGRGRST